MQETEFDFRKPRKVGACSYDHNFYVSDQRTAENPVAVLVSSNSGIQMELSSTEPGLQFYSGTHMNYPDKRILAGETFRAYSGLAPEPQC